MLRTVDAALQLETLFVLAAPHRITTTREPGGVRAPAFVLVRDATSCAWAVGTHVAPDLADAFAELAREEQPTADPELPPLHEARYRALLAGAAVYFGPRFVFPEAIDEPRHPIHVISDERALARHFRGWVRGEIAAGRAPVMAVVLDGAPVSVCFSARSTDHAAEAGVDTADAHRGRGYAGSVTAAWAGAIRASGRVPFYSTSWTNHASLAVVRKLGLVACASSWSLGASPAAAQQEADGRGENQRIG